jgi:hypothetical protein
MFIFVVPTLQKKWNEIRMKELAVGKMYGKQLFFEDLEVQDVKITRCSEDDIRIGKQGSKWDNGDKGDNATWDSS